MHKIFLFVVFILISVFPRFSAAVTPCGKTITKYFSSAELKRYPPHPSHPQSEEWAKDQEQKGGSHYIADFCENGDIISLTKRLNKKVFFRYDYIYDSGKLTAVDLTDEQGKRRYQP